MPMILLIGILCSCSALITPAWANAFAPPGPSTTTTLFGTSRVNGVSLVPVPVALGVLVGDVGKLFSGLDLQPVNANNKTKMILYIGLTTPRRVGRKERIL